MAGALALGALGGRLVPPLVAGAMGAMRSQLGHDPFERLKQDHRHIMSVLARMVAASGESAAKRAPLLLSLKRTLGKHALAEEDVVYPILHQHGAAEAASKRLYAEHADMKIHLYELEAALRANTGWNGRVESLRSLVARHIRAEEDEEFPKLHALLDRSGMRTVSGQIRREEALLV